jgi:hypothetical protein
LVDTYAYGVCLIEAERVTKMRGMMSAMLAGATVCLALSGCGSGTSANVPAASDPKDTAVAPAGGDAKPAGIVMPVKIVLECEDATTLEDKSANGVTVIEVKTASEGKSITYLEIPDEVIEKKCGIKKNADTAGVLPGKATYVFETPREDTYYINLRAKWADSCGNSVWVKMDESTYFNLEDEEGKLSDKNYKWAWHQLESGGRPKGFKLSAGKHTLHMAVREDGPKLDQWVISTEASRQTGEAAKAIKEK